ncbi:hypothetical protein QCA50_005621 [Cerrena zonata]|uniref:Uncharacterized protein n=1 Tax=Cerrena zonata TaxID=2478898 RepID=A0AAW0GAS3_9APHY
MASTQATRPIHLTSGQVKVSIPVSTSCDQWLIAETLRDEFNLTQDANAIDTTLENESEPSVELHTRFLDFVAQKLQKEPTDSITSVALEALKHFTASYLSQEDIHTVTVGFEPTVRKSILTNYYNLLATLEASDVEVPRAPKSALISAATDGDASLYALFGGQGPNEVYFDELQALYETYKSYVANFIEVISHEVLVPLAKDSEETTYYTHGLDVHSWLSGATPRPPVAYLASVPISLPLIGLTQLTQYLIVSRVAGICPGELRTLFGGATGHSQGLVSAVAVAASSSIESFFDNSKKAAKWLFFCALRGQQYFPLLALEPTIIQDALDGGEGVPSPMLSVAGLTLKDLEPHVKNTNAHLPEKSQLEISLHNGPRVFVVTGPPRALYGLVTNLRKRKPVFSIAFLPINVPFHSQYLEGATDDMFDDDLEGEELWTPTDLEIPVYHTETGEDLRKLTTSLTKSLCDQIFTSHIHWSKATNFPETATHAVDFGPGGASGIGPLTSRNLEGRGVRVIVTGNKAKGTSELFGQTIRREVWWSKKFTPNLVKTSDGTLHLDTPFSQLLGKPPLMVGGMTPTTVQSGFVSATLNAGFHIELAGGGHYNAKALRAKVAEIQSKIAPGVGLTLNALYINPRQFTFQFPLWQEMRREGVPIEGFCVAAGIPSTEKAAEIIEGLKSSGIKHVSFKPGSVDGIRQVINIAAANPDFPIILQWTGGRAGGHHSCEDFHQPILSTYGSIRQHSNIILVGGSGFGGADDVWPYLTGDWSVEQYEVQPMPFDGFLFASRVMVAKEAHTSSFVKDLIVAASGVGDAQWEGTYAKETGGILTVRSELGEPIHKIATRGVKLWKEFDNTVFNLPKEKRAAWLNERRSEIIAKLNKDFAKPWFGWKKDGSVVEDIADMTYEEVTLRLIRLMYVAHEERWIDISLRNLTGDWLRRVEERFAGVNGSAKASILQSFKSLDKPEVFVKEFFKTYPLASEQLLAAEDKKYFLTISQRPGQKPAPFIPVLDASFEVWFKKDSLWAAEDIEAVFDQDPQRVCILQGPVAVKHSKVKDEPIKDLLGNITNLLAQRLLERLYNGDASKVPTVDYLGARPSPLSEATVAALGVERTMTETQITYTIGSSVPETSVWLETLAGPRLDWLRAFLITPAIVRGTAYIDNPLRRLFAPRTSQKVVIDLEDGLPTSISLFGAARSYGAHKSDFKVVEAKLDAAQSIINVTLFEDRKDSSVPLYLQFEYKPSMGSAPIHEVAGDRNNRIKDFYYRLWFGDDESLPELDARGTFTSPEVVIDEDEVEDFCAIVGNQGEAFKSTRNEIVQAPMDFAIVTGWQSIMKSVFPTTIDGDLLRLVHLSNGFRLIEGATPLKAGDKCRGEAKIVSVINTDAGKAVKVKGHIIRDNVPVLEVVSSFLYRGHYTDFENTFELTEEPDYIVDLSTDPEVGVLQSKEWFEWDDDSKPLQAGTKLIFRVKSEVTYRNPTCFKTVKVSGDIFVRDQIKQLIKVGSVDFSQDDSRGNPVVEYIKRHGEAQGQVSPLPSEYTMATSPGLTVFNTPFSNEPYSKVSGDFNPIHINPYFSDFAGLPGTITHGMWSSAATRRFVEVVAAQGHPERVVSYDVSFVGMVLPGDELKVTLKHTAMRAGNLVLKVITENERGEKVIEGTAEVAQPATVYVFTGQGSQEPGMGMELYNNSPAARGVWKLQTSILLLSTASRSQKLSRITRRSRLSISVVSKVKPFVNVTWT